MIPASSILSFGNPAVWWTGLGALGYVIFKLCAGKGRRTDLYIVLGFLAQYLPWVLVPRSTFIYHYFASVPFIILATVMLLRDISIRYRRLGKGLSLGLIALSVILFAAFYPLLSGMPALRSYLKYLHWFNWFYY